MKEHVEYAIETDLNPAELKELLIKSTLSNRRPVEDDRRLQQMCMHANLIISARLNGRLIGIARSLSDFSFCTYLSDLAVDEAYQKMGIGKRLISETRKASSKAMLILLAAPDAVDYYPHIGMERFTDCYLFRGTN